MIGKKTFRGAVAAVAATGLSLAGGGLLIATASANTPLPDISPATFIGKNTGETNTTWRMGVGDGACTSVSVYNNEDYAVTITGIDAGISSGFPFEVEYVATPDESFPVVIEPEEYRQFNGGCTDGLLTAGDVAVSEFVLDAVIETDAGNIQARKHYFPTTSATMTAEATQTIVTHYDVTGDGQVTVGDWLEGSWTTENTGDATHYLGEAATEPWGGAWRLAEEEYQVNEFSTSTRPIWYLPGESRTHNAPFEIYEDDLTGNDLNVDFSVSVATYDHAAPPEYVSEADTITYAGAAGSTDWLLDPSDSTNGRIEVYIDKVLEDGESWSPIKAGDEIAVALQMNNLTGEDLTGIEPTLTAAETADELFITFNPLETAGEGWSEILASGTYQTTKADAERGYVLFGFRVDSDQGPVGYDSDYIVLNIADWTEPEGTDPEVTPTPKPGDEEDEEPTPTPAPTPKPGDEDDEQTEGTKYTPSAEDLVTYADTEGNISAPGKFESDTIINVGFDNVDVSEDTPLDVWIFSDPTLLRSGVLYQSATPGAAVYIPADITVGDHHIVVYNADTGAVVGFQSVEVLAAAETASPTANTTDAAGGTLADTGANGGAIAIMIAAVLAMVLVGGNMLFSARRQATFA